VTHHGPVPAGELPSELVLVLTEFSNALNKHTMYPAGHPMLVTAADQLAVLLNRTFGRRNALVLGISPNQIIAGGVASDPGHPIISELAARLHRRNIGVLKLFRGVERGELDQALGWLSSEDREGERSATQRWPHISVHPLSYSRLELIGDSDEPDARSSWANSLWLDLSRVAMESEVPAVGAADPAQVARAIDVRQWDDAYGQKLTESLTDVLDACRARGGMEALALQSHISKLVTSMAPETLERLVLLERNEAERQRFLLEMTQSMAVDAVLDLVQAAAMATGRSISPALLQLLGKLAEHSEQGAVETRDRAGFAFRNQVRQLIEGWEDWEANDPAPADHQRSLEHLGLAGQSPLRGHSSTYECEPERVLMMCLEVGAANSSTSSAAAFLIDQGKTPLLRDLFHKAPSPPLAADILRSVATDKALRALLQRDPLDISAIELFVTELKESAVLPLIEALVTSDTAERRDPILRMLVPFAEAAGTEALARIEGVPWPVQRNLLTLLTRLTVLPRGFSPTMFIDHPEARVRTEALRLLFRGPGTRVRAICEALSARDPATVRMGVFASIEDCPAAAVPLLIPLIERGDLETGIRSSAVAAIAAVPQPLVLDCLLGLCFIGGRWFRRPRIAGKAPIVLAALTALSRHWSHHPRAREVLELAAGHPDAEVRSAAEHRPR
jgi:hypothetical protein